MKQLAMLLLLTSIIFRIDAQNYISLAPSLTASPGTILEKGNLALEYGHQWDVFSLGIDIGKTSLSHVKGRDTTTYFEIRPNLNIFQQGRFTNTFTPGIGYVVNAEENLVLEFTSGIEYAFSEKLHFNVYFGQYYYSGKYSSSTVNFFGVSAAYYFKPTHPSPLITKDPPQ